MTLGTPLLTSEDVATYFNVDVVTVRRLVSRNELTAYRIGSEYRFMLQDVLDFLDRQRIVGNGSHSALSEAACDAAVTPKGILNFEEHATPAARRILQAAVDEARQFKHPHVGSEHLLLAIMRDEQSKSSAVLRGLGVSNYSQVRSAVEGMMGQGGGEDVDTPQLTRGMRHILSEATAEARTRYGRRVDTPFLLLALCRIGKGPAVGVLGAMGVSIGDVQDAIQRELSPAE